MDAWNTNALADACVYGLARRRAHQQAREREGGAPSQRPMDAQVVYASRTRPQEPS